MFDDGIVIIKFRIKNTPLAQDTIVQCPGLHKGTGEEANMTAVDTHVDSVHWQCSFLDDLACLVERKDLALNTNERVLFEGETARCVLLAVASPIGAVDAENIQQKAIWVPGNRVCLLGDENWTLVRI